MMRFEGYKSGVPTGTIVIWSGAIVNIPNGFSLCDGSNGRPDLRNNFVVGAGNGYKPGDKGGTLVHTHIGESTHTHTLAVGATMAAGTDKGGQTGAPTKVGETGSAGTLPPFYSMAYIMKD